MHHLFFFSLDKHCIVLIRMIIQQWQFIVINFHFNYKNQLSYNFKRYMKLLYKVLLYTHLLPCLLPQVSCVTNPQWLKLDVVLIFLLYLFLVQFNKIEETNGLLSDLNLRTDEKFLLPTSKMRNITCFILRDSVSY